MTRIERDGRALTGGGSGQDGAAVDEDVAGAVGRVLRDELRQRMAEASKIDALFSQDIAERVARFTLGGKRMRSQFLWWGLRAAGGGDLPEQAHSAVRVAAALELLQTCALVHDDVMDGSSLRRGRPSVHQALVRQYGSTGADGRTESFGRSGAILVGDLALAWADDMVADTELPPDLRQRVRDVWRTLRTEMVAGQYLELHGQVTGLLSASRAIRTASLKSGLYSVERPLALGAAIAGADHSMHDALCAAGRRAGIAFQLNDDLAGSFGDPAVTGKPAGEDIRSGTPNYLFAVARERTEAAGDRAGTSLLDSALAGRPLCGDTTERIRELLVTSGARAAVESMIAELLEQSADRLAAVAIPAVPHVMLLRLFRLTAGRRDASDTEGAPLAGRLPSDSAAPHPPHAGMRDAGGATR